MKKVIFTILDGVGIKKEEKGNAVLNAKTPCLDKIKKMYPNSKLKASGNSVGLPKGQMGNSEVGHITIGSGRIVNQPLERINKSLEDKSFYKNETIRDLMKKVKKDKTNLHIFGLISPGGIHSHIKHIFSFFDIAKELEIENLYIHAFLDGRDVLYNSAEKYLDELSDYLNKKGIGKIATVSGRYYAMDREKIWDRTKKSYDAIFNGKGEEYSNYHELLKDSYKNEIYDEFVKPCCLDKEGIVKDGDGIIIANFRPDRIPQLAKAAIEKDFKEFETHKYNNLKLITMMPVSDELKVPSIFNHITINNTLGEILSKKGYRVLRIAETSKYPHVTHFIDGDKDVELKNTDKVLIPRKNVSTYDKAPEMSAKKVTDYIKDNIDNYDFVIVNYANGDMVGHTGNYEAAIKAVETLDRSVSTLYNLALEKDILLVLLADHGNCEEMYDKDGNPHTYHTTNPISFVVCDENYKLEDGQLSDIAPSILNILGIDIPNEMTGNIIITKNN